MPESESERPYFSTATHELIEVAYHAHARREQATFDAVLTELEGHRSSQAARDAAYDLRQLSPSPSAASSVSASSPRLVLDGPVPSDAWLRKVLDVVSRFQPTELGEHNLYVAVLYDEDAREHGVYVGETSKQPEERYADHKRGHKAGRKWVTRFGIGLLPLPQFRNILRSDAKVFERDMALALVDAGFWVQGGR